MEDREREPEMDDGTHPVHEHPPEVATAGRSVAQTVIIVVGVLVVLAALLWLVVPFGGS